MNLLFTGRGGSGSWTVRGEQLGQACGATVKPLAGREDCKAADLVVVVKRTPSIVTTSLQGKPWVFDLVDFYPQPTCRFWSQDEAIGWVRHQIKHLRPNGIIWPTQRMREDCDIGLPGIVLPHHHRPGIARNPIREHVTTVGYEGRALYLDGWQEAIERECKRRGWEFVVNPENLADLDIVIAVRGGQWRSYAATHWKSNVKLANSHGSGTPFIGQQEYGYLETRAGAEYWVDEPKGVGMCFDWLTPQSTRKQVQERFLKRAYPVEQAAADLMGFLRGL